MHQVLPGNSKQQSMTQTHRLQNLILPRFWKIERAYPHPIRKASKLGLTITKRCFCHGVHDLRFQQQTLFSLRQQDALFRDLTCPFLETALNEKYKSPTTKTYNSFYKTIHWCQKIHSKKWKKIWYLVLFQACAVLVIWVLQYASCHIVSHLLISKCSKVVCDCKIFIF